MSWTWKSNADGVTFSDSATNRSFDYKDPSLENMNDADKINHINELWTKMIAELSHAYPRGPKV